MSIESGNLDKLNDKAPDMRGWFVGSFIDTKTIRHSGSVEVKWVRHKKGMTRQSPSKLYPKARTLVVLISGKWIQRFEQEPKEVSLTKAGDYVIFTGQPHSSESLEDSTLIGVRWNEK